MSKNISGKAALFPGSFDPFTVGHASVVERGLELFDRIIIVVGVNVRKKTMFTPEQRVAQIEALYKDNPRVEVVAWNGLTVDLARLKGAVFILRSVRSVADFEYERTMADVNEQISAGKQEHPVRTVMFFAEPGLAAVQSSVVRELITMGQDVSQFVPGPVLERL